MAEILDQNGNPIALLAVSDSVARTKADEAKSLANQAMNMLQDFLARTPEYGAATTNGLPARWQGVNVLWWGNSIIQGQGLTLAQHWITKIGTMNGMTNQIFGYPGQPWGYSGTGTDNSIYSKRTLLPKTAKLVVMYLGGNDNRLNIPLGTTTERSNLTFCGALNLAADYVLSNFPAGTRIVFASSLQRNGGDDGTGNPITPTTKNQLDKTLIDYNLAGLAVARARGFDFWDMFGIGLNQTNISQYTSDGVHPNPLGAERIALAGYGYFESLDLPSNTAPVADTTAPTAPTITLGSKTQTQVVINWSGATDNVAVTGYRVYRGGTLIASPGAGVTTYTNTGLSANTPYAYQVAAVDAAGNESAKSNTLNVTTDAATGDVTNPTAPTLAAGTPGTTGVTLTLSGATDNVAVTSYDIYKDGVFLANTTNTTYNVTGLVEGTTYAFKAKAKDAAGNVSPDSNTVSVTTAVSGGGTPTTYFNDTFTGANGSLNGHVAETGQTWDTSIATTPANWTINGNNVKYTGTTGDKILINSGAASGDYTVTANVWAAGGKLGVAFRGLNGTNYLYAKYDSATAGAELKLFKRSDVTGTATTTQLAAAAHTINTASSHDFKIVVAGDTVNVYIAGSATPALTHQLSTADATEYAGRTWVGMYAGGENTSQWNSLKVESNA